MRRRRRDRWPGGPWATAVGRCAGVAAAALLTLPLAFVAAGCGGGGGDGAAGDDRAGDPDGGEAGAGGEVQGSVTVLAAASLTDAMGQVGEAFEETNPGVAVELNVDGSSSLRDQILAGAPADVFASADEATMQAVVEADAVAAEPRIFATNDLTIVVPAGNPGGVESLADLGDDDLLVGLCAEEVPCGRLGREVLANAGVTPAPDTNEPDVRSLLDKVSAGELDVGLVYTTDVRAAGSAVEGITIPDDDNVTTAYPVAPLAGSGNPPAAAAFVDFLVAGGGQDILDAHGFGPP